jgi:hypothetical protein
MLRQQGSGPAIGDPRESSVVAHPRALRCFPPTNVPWLDTWLGTTTDLARLRASHPMVDAVIDEVDGRLTRIGSHWLIDFTSCNYLGFDVEPQIIDYATVAVPPLVPERHASFRLQIIAVNTWEQIEQLVRTLGELSDRFRLQSAVAA